MINLDSYRQQLESSIAKVTGQGSLSQSDDDNQGSLSDTGSPNEEDSGGGGGSLPDNLAAAPAPATPAGATDASPPKNIDVMPPGMNLKFDSDKLKSAKSVEDHVDAMEPDSRKKFLSWYEKTYGNINDNYNAMLQAIGKKPDENRSLSKKEKWTALMNFGVSLIKASSNPDNTLVGSLAQATGDTVQGIGASRQAEGQQYDQTLSSAQKMRNDQLKELGNYGSALKGQASLDTSEAALDRAKNAPNEVAGVEDTNNGLMGRTRAGQLKPLIDPTTGKVAKSNPDAKSGASRSTYESQRDDLADLIRSNNPKMNKQDAKNAAVKQLNDKKKPNGVSPVSLRKQAEEFAYKEMGSPKDYRASKNAGKPYSQALAEAADRNYQMLLHIQTPDNDGNAAAPPPPASRPPLASFHH